MESSPGCGTADARNEARLTGSRDESFVGRHVVARGAVIDAAEGRYEPHGIGG
jgi:hypothetical protein